MKNWGSLKINYFSNKKAQTLTELATFGSVLLLVLSFFISYGMRYNYQQDVQMRAFRKALSEAYASGRPDASATITLVEDKHVPDPRDMFGAGSITPVTGQAEVTWGNTLQNEYKNPADYSRIKYKINETDKEYTTEAFVTIHKTMYPGFYADIPGMGKQYITWPQVRCYQPNAEPPKQLRILLVGNETEIINAIYLPVLGTDGKIKPGEFEKENLPIVGIVPPGASDSDPVDGVNVRTPKGGAINPYYLNINNEGVTPANLQGLLLDSRQNIRRSGTLTIKETPGETISTSTYKFEDADGVPTTLTHKIRGNSGTAVPAAPTDIPYTFPRSKTSTWSTNK